MTRTSFSIRRPPDVAEAAEKATVRRRSFLPRFGLRTLFVLAVVLCLLAAWVGRNFARVRQEDAAIEALLQVHATIGLAFDGEPNEFTPTDQLFLQEAPGDSWTYYVARSVGWEKRPQIESVGLRGKDAADAKLRAALDALSVLPEIKEVDLTGSAFDDDTIRRLESVSGLESLSLSGTKVTSAGLAPLSKTAQLRSVYVHYVTTDVVAALPRFVELRSVSLSMMDVAASDVEGIATLPNLEQLDLYGVRFAADPAFYAPLEQAAKLKTLHVDPDRRLSDVDLAAISKLRNLEALYLSGITDAQLAGFDLPPVVQKIVLHSLVTEEGAREFSASHPDCLVHIYRTPFGGPRFRAGEPVSP